MKKKKPWKCRDANQLIINWQNANSASEVSWDFLETNIGLIHSHVKKIRLLFNFIPLGRTKSYRIYRASRNAEIAKKLLYKDTHYKKEDLNRYGKRYKKNLGKIMLSVKELEPQKKKVADFFEKNKCRTYL